jgi:hypothetical protein
MHSKNLECGESQGVLIANEFISGTMENFVMGLN